MRRSIRRYAHEATDATSADFPAGPGGTGSNCAGRGVMGTGLWTEGGTVFPMAHGRSRPGVYRLAGPGSGAIAPKSGYAAYAAGAGCPGQGGNAGAFGPIESGGTNAHPDPDRSGLCPMGLLPGGRAFRGAARGLEQCGQPGVRTLCAGPAGPAADQSRTGGAGLSGG